LLVRKRVSRVLLTVALTGSVLSAVGQQATALPNLQAVAASSVASGGPASSLVTLITGDRIMVSGDSYSVQYDPARRDVNYLAYRHDGHLTVIPSDAIGLLGDQLDSQLFDVTALAQMGYKDGQDLGVIVMHDKNSKAAAKSAVSDAGDKLAADLYSINGFAVREGKGKAGNLWKQLTTGNNHGRKLQKGITKIWLDGISHTSLDQSVPQVGAPLAWAAGFDGTGIKIGIVDTGIDTTHPDLAGKVVAASDFTGEGLQDDFGHGTHVASIAAGTGAASGGQFKGVAPGAQLINAKACNHFGSCPDSWVISAMQYAANQGAKVINMSLGGPDLPGVQPLEQAVNDLTASNGVLFIIAAGNTNPPVPQFSVSSPSTADAAVSVGAVAPDDSLAFFSNRGPRVGDAFLKPDITAPGMNITAARSSTSSLPGGQYTDLSGTSMATPHVAGGAAILLQSHPTWTPAQLKSALIGSAQLPFNSTSVFDQGGGRLDVGYGYHQSVLASPPSVSLGRQVGPHSDDPVDNRTITYTNLNPTSGVNLTLTLKTEAPGGGAAPAGMFTLSSSTLNLAPGGTGSVTLTSTSSVSAPDGLYGGWVQASGNAGGVHVETPFGVHRAPAGRELTFNNLNRSGNITDGYATVLLPLTAGNPVYPIVSNSGSGLAGPRTEFIQNGDYILVSSIPEASTGYLDRSLLANPKFTVDASTPSTIDLLAAQAQPVNITVPNPSAVTNDTEIAIAYTNNPNVAFQTLGSGNLFTKQLGPANTFYPNLMTKVHRSAYVPAAGRTDSRNAPSLYNVAWFPEQQFPTGFTGTVTAAQLAQRTVNYGRNTGTGAVGTKEWHPQPSGRLFIPNFSTLQTVFDLPFTRTEYVNTDGIRWDGYFSERTFPGGNETFAGTQDSGLIAYTAGSTGTENWNKPVYGPAFGNAFRVGDWVSRKGDVISFLPPMLGDSGGHAGTAWPVFAPLDGLSGSVTLKRNGTTVATANLAVDPLGPHPSATVPAAFDHYTLDATLSRGGPVDLATQVSATWAFTSATVDPNNPVPLPLWSVQFSPTLNANNSAPGGSFAIPLSAVAQQGSGVSGINTITVQYSTNDGATWTNATVTGSGANRTATVVNPASGNVSLRATVTDFASNSVTQTTVRAYHTGL
jgi:subtilisin family serine protease